MVTETTESLLRCTHGVLAKAVGSTGNGLPAVVQVLRELLVHRNIIIRFPNVYG